MGGVQWRLGVNIGLEYWKVGGWMGIPLLELRGVYKRSLILICNRFVLDVDLMPAGGNSLILFPS